MKRLKIKVIGDVQGVFYRFSAKQEAEKLDIKGFAQNEPDDSVAVIAEGREKELNQFVDWLRIGSPMAEVRDVQVEEHGYKGEFKKFEVR